MALKKTEKYGLAFLGIVFGSMILLLIFNPNHDRRPKMNQTAKPTEIEAWVMVQDFVENRLPSPSTAKFPWKPHRVVETGNGCFFVVAHVDSQNVFGATVRTKFNCEVCTENGKQWTLKALNTY